ncbi:hypothetical protein [Mycobacterium celatum]|uniref:Uncharacterized protein n=2 Tax=Mycobacterium celatum TaxID=28045 RepID=A0A1X1RWR6_MYCCE|nr:hypothetical protein [Mycobacterium celatum]ORV19561.1 hypothetical protein AWB95_01285 [Mycobacterium celatum]
MTLPKTSVAGFLPKTALTRLSGWVAADGADFPFAVAGSDVDGLVGCSRPGVPTTSLTASLTAANGFHKPGSFTDSDAVARSVGGADVLPV